jgi:hypothetical protein
LLSPSTSNHRPTSTTLPSPLLPRSADLDFFPRTTISFAGNVGSLTLSRLATVLALVSSISGAPSGGVNIISDRALLALLCLLAFGREKLASFDSGRALLLLVRTVGVVLFWDGENMVNDLLRLAGALSRLKIRLGAMQSSHLVVGRWT